MIQVYIHSGVSNHVWWGYNNNRYLHINKEAVRLVDGCASRAKLTSASIEKMYDIKHELQDTLKQKQMVQYSHRGYYD